MLTKQYMVKPFNAISHIDCHAIIIQLICPGVTVLSVAKNVLFQT